LLGARKGKQEAMNRREAKAGKAKVVCKRRKTSRDPFAALQSRFSGRLAGAAGAPRTGRTCVLWGVSQRDPAAPTERFYGPDGGGHNGS